MTDSSPEAAHADNTKKVPVLPTAKNVAIHSAILLSKDNASKADGTAVPSVAAAAAVSPLRLKALEKCASFSMGAKKPPKLITCHVCKKKKQPFEFSKKQQKRDAKNLSALCSSCAAASAKVKKPSKKKPAAEATSIAVPKVTPFDLDVAELFKRYMSLTHNDDAYINTLVNILSQHRLVRSKKLEIKTSKHNFTVEGFKPNVREFSAWVKTKEGKPYQKLAKEGDDALYRISKVLRNCLPRGCHAVSIEDKARNKIRTCLFRGIRKFTGLVSSDDGDDPESDLSGAYAYEHYFRKKSIKHVSSFFSTHKSNGENAKLSVLVVEGTRYLMSGSKTTCNIWPADEPFCKHQPDPDPSNAHPNAGYTIGCIYSNWFLTRSKKIQDEYFREMWTSKSGNKVIIGEVNRPWAEHVLPIDDSNAYIEVFCIVDESGFEMSPTRVFKFFEDNLGMQTRDLAKDRAFPKNHNRPESFWRNTWNSLRLTQARTQSAMLYCIHREEEKSVKELDAHTALIRADQSREGSVLYMCDEDGAVLNLLKVFICILFQGRVTYFAHLNTAKGLKRMCWMYLACLTA